MCVRPARRTQSQGRGGMAGPDSPSVEMRGSILISCCLARTFFVCLCVPLLFLGYFPSVAPHACDAALSLYASPQDSRAVKTGERLMPNSVRAYSTLGGTSA